MTQLADIAPIAPGEASGIRFLQRRGSEKGLSLLLLHGVGSQSRSFTPVMAALAPSLNVIAWNAPGYGGSQPLPMKIPHPRDYADAVLRLLDTLGLERVVLIGHSLGCLFAASFTALHASRVTALALLSPALGYQVSDGKDLPPTVQARIDEINSLGAESFAAKRAGRLVYEPARKPQVLAGVQQGMAALDLAGYAQAVHALGAGDLLADAAQISTPTLVAVGAEDVVTPPANAKATYAALSRGVGYHEIPDAGHALPQENPIAVAALLMQLIEHNND